MSGLRVVALAPGLWRWSAAGSPCPRGDVASTYCETDGAIVLVDPVVPPPGSEVHARFFRALDRDVERVGGPVLVLATCPEHARDVAELRSRYPRLLEALDGVRVTSTSDPNETCVHLASHDAIVTGHAEPQSHASLVLSGHDSI